MIEADRADHSRAKLDHDLIVPITSRSPYPTLYENGFRTSKVGCFFIL